MSDLASTVIAAQNGNHDAFGQIVTRFQDMAFASAYSMLGDATLAQDAAQEAFLDAYQSLSKLREPAAFPGWFRRIILKHSDRQIRGKRIPTVPIENVYDLRSSLPDPAMQMEEALQREDLHAALDLLPEKQRMVALLFYVEGYSQKEIAAFLEVPITAIKKRLVNARQNLKERMAHMVQKELQATKPSNDDTFANQVRFFTAVLDGDVPTVKLLVQKDASLLDLQAEWKMAIPRQYWTGLTALDQAAGYGNTEMVQMLLDLGADVNTRNRSQMTPLHTAAIMRHHDVAQLLLAKGADVNAQSSIGQTPLHISATRNDVALAQMLLDQGVDVNLTDKQQRRAVDWAMLHNNQNFVDLLTANGSETATTKPHGWAVSAPEAILETGIKVVDLFAPLKRGAISGIFTPMSGVGFMVITSQIMRSIQKLYGGSVIMAGLDTDVDHAEHWRIFLRESDADQDVAYYFSGRDKKPSPHMQTITKALGAAKQALQEKEQVLVVVNSNLAAADGIMEKLQSACLASAAEVGTLSVLIYGHHSPRLLPEALADVDATIAFDRERARHRLYPAVDPVKSHSALFDGPLAGSDHEIVADDVRRVLERYGELRAEYELGGMEILWYIDDDPALEETIARARRLERFLTQPLFGVEPWTGVVGEYVPLPEIIRGCRAILNGAYDDVPEEAFSYIGSIDQVVRKK